MHPFRLKWSNAPSLLPTRLAHSSHAAAGPTACRFNPPARSVNQPSFIKPAADGTSALLKKLAAPASHALLRRMDDITDKTTLC
ncbi:hypothetical protein Q8A64_01815 [Oxalobacteraceae bacterium R-40]|uniref:Uncharacterized protein n=1 Tax=Keguizhuia sedimenti TaxID=3064264 RepID=A0ABU1BJV4_9BURK|nr:hypothetical protein [Oxalobacteraceae bacterium R-40]